MDNKKQNKENILGYVTHNVFDKSGRLLLTEGTPLTLKVVQKLEERKLSFRISAVPLGHNPAKSKPVSLQAKTTKPFRVPQRLDKKFERLNGESISHAAKYMNWILRQIHEDVFLNNNIKILAQGHKANYSHSINVALISVAIARKLKYNKTSLHELALGSLYHDIGKILLPKSVLDDIAGVCDGQTLIYQQHTVLGSDLLAANKLPEGVYLIARQHHEKHSGNGYPNGIKGNDIHLNAAIVAVADTFDRLTSAIFHRNVLSPDEAIKQIVLAQGIDYPPQVVDMFVELFNTD
jgi:putative nucleotidyltransferase with HDIG domain